MNGEELNCFDSVEKCEAYATRCVRGGVCHILISSCNPPKVLNLMKWEGSRAQSRITR